MVRDYITNYFGISYDATNVPIGDIIVGAKVIDKRDVMQESFEMPTEPCRVPHIRLAHRRWQCSEIHAIL